MDTFMTTYDQYVTIINKQLNEYLAQTDDMYQSVLDAMRYSIENGGKRVRPVLLLEFCRLCGGDINVAMPFACALEMIHTYSLIHDDLPCMDDDDYRRGRPSCHKKFGEAVALLAGDALLTQAFAVVANSPTTHGVAPHLAIKALVTLSNYAGVDGMIGGQIIDLESEGTSISRSVLTRMHSLKTAALIKAGCAIGAILAGGDEANIEAAKDYGQSLGLAFQIVDDILDVTGDFASLGKPIGSDAQSQKTTFVSLMGIEQAKLFAKELSNKACNALQAFDDHEFLEQLTAYLLAREN